MTADERAFLQHVADHFDDDVPRLVYADWLDEQGRSPRAEFIRVQCALARAEATGGTVTKLRRREQELFRTIGRELIGPFPNTDCSSCRRGFLQNVVLSTPKFIQHHEYLGSLLPLPNNIVLTLLTEQLDAIRSLTALSVVTDLYIKVENPDARSTVGPKVESVLRAVIWTRLRHLSLSNLGLHLESLQPLEQTQSWPALRFLNLSANQFSNQALASLWQLPVTQQLELLDLSSNHIDNVGAALLLASGMPEQLKTLNLNDNHFGSWQTHLLRQRFGTMILCERS